MSRVVHFELVGENPDRMAKFYAETFGWKVQKWEGPLDYWLVTTGEDGAPGINGGLGRRSSPDEQGTTNTLEVMDARAAVAAVEKNGGKVTLALHAIPGVGWQAYCADTEGNVFGIHQNDPNAK
ncbi:MAG TPA: VOC family protein [Anaerolineales bacterium]|nr:VOC family protein [Anaerolineales bacterium]